MYVRTVKVKSSNGTVNEYLRVVEAYRHHGKVKQRTVADLGRKDLLRSLLPKLQKVLLGESTANTLEEPHTEILDASTWGPVRVVQILFQQLHLWKILDDSLSDSRGNVSFADRAFVLLANRLIAPKSEHGLAEWLETDFVADRQGRRFIPRWRQRRRVRVHHQQLDAWYRTLDRLLAAKSRIEKALYRQLRDLFSLQVDFVLYDLTSTYFEGVADEAIAKHGYSRDGKRRKVQVVVGVVMVAGWPIAHHVFAGNRKDGSTVEEVLADLKQRFGCQRVVFVGDRGMVSEANLDWIRKQDQGYLVGLKRRRNAQLDGWLQGLDESKWEECAMGINAQEKQRPQPSRVQEVESGEEGMRVFVIDSPERRDYEQKMRQKAMEKTRQSLEKLQERVASGRLRRAEKIGAAAARILGRHHGSRYYDWRLRGGAFEFFEHPTHLLREKRLEGKYVIATSETDIRAVDAVAQYKELMEVERGFRHLKDIIQMRPIHHRTAPRIKAHIFVATLALLLERLLERRLKDAEVDLSAPAALEAVSTIRLVTFRLDDRPARRGISGGSPRARQVLKALGIADLKPPSPPPGEETVM